MEKSSRKCAPKLVPVDPFLILVNNPKQPLHTRKIKIRYFERRLSKSL